MAFSLMACPDRTNRAQIRDMFDDSCDELLRELENEVLPRFLVSSAYQNLLRAWALPAADQW